MTARRKPEPTSPLFEERGLFADVETVPTTPVDELELPRELAPGVIAYPTTPAPSRPSTPADRRMDALERCVDALELKADAVLADNSPEAVAARRQMFAGFGWTTTTPKET